MVNTRPNLEFKRKDYDHKNYNLISPLNKLNEYMIFTPRDKVLCDFIDYVSFYGCWSDLILMRLLASDNWPAVYVGRISIHPAENSKLRTCYGEVIYRDHVVRIFRLQELKLPSVKKWVRYLKCDLYWKWVKLIREIWLRHDFYRVMTDYCGFNDIVLTRADYTVDCAVYNFNKKNTLRTMNDWSISKTVRKKRDRDLDTLNMKIFEYNEKFKQKRKKVQYLLFGNKSSSTARFIRYYDKKAEIIARWTAYMYPEYFEYPNVMRYELQVNSKWFDDEERYMKIEDIENFINFWYSINTRHDWKHRQVKNWTLYEYVAYAIRKLKRENDYTALEKIKLLLLDPQELWDTDCRVLCETSDPEKRSEHF